MPGTSGDGQARVNDFEKFNNNVEINVKEMFKLLIKLFSIINEQVAESNFSHLF
jgi:signal transduction histidine kinase